MLSVWLSDRWMDELGAVTHPIFALVAITFIAFVPGFMNAFMVASLLLDRRPQRVTQAFYPGVTVLIAAYQEEDAIADTLESIANEDYPGPLEVLVLNDGSTDRTVEFAAGRWPSSPSPTMSMCAFSTSRRTAAKRPCSTAGLPKPSMI